VRENNVEKLYGYYPLKVSSSRPPRCYLPFGASHPGVARASMLNISSGVEYWAEN